MMAQAEAGQGHEELAKDFLGMWGQCSLEEREKLLAGGNVVAQAAELLEVAYGDPFSELSDRLFLAGLEIQRLAAEIQACLARNELPKVEDTRMIQNLGKCIT